MRHRSRIAHFVIDVDDLDRGVAFGSAALDAKEEPLSEASSQVYRKLRLPDSDVGILLQRTADPKKHKERMHLDLESDNVEAEVCRLETLGATRWDRVLRPQLPRPTRPTPALARPPGQTPCLESGDG
jgi:predicted enzyme related to lactoylglutathione lyase